LRRQAAVRNRKGQKKNALARISGYLRKIRKRMRYDEYLREGNPIAVE
jgi:hypothetical protein